MDMQKLYLPGAETYVGVDNGEVRGFLSLMGDHVAALFVRTERQRRGIGSQLLAHAKGSRNALSVCVYTRNEGARRFYEAAGFEGLEQRLEPESGEQELLMGWARGMSG